MKNYKMTNRDSPISSIDVIADERTLVSRSKEWAQMLAKYEAIKDSPDMLFGSFCASAIDEETESKERSAPSSDYETDEDGRSGKDLQPEFERVKKAAAERNARMQQSGLDVLLDTFCMAEIEKVEKWLENHGNFFSGFMEGKNMNDMRLQTLSKIDRKDCDSVSSVDTAKYILSNRKKGSARVTMTTIKEFRFQKQFNNEFGVNRTGINERMGHEVKLTVNDENRPRSNNFGRRTLFANRSRKRYKRESSSDLSSSEEQLQRDRRFRDKRLRRKTFSRKKRRARSYSSSESSYIKPRKSNAIHFTKSSTVSLEPSSISTVSLEQNIKGKTSDINQNLEFVKATRIQTIVNKDSEINNEVSESSSKSNLSNARIILYTPRKPINEYPKDLIINGKVRITDKYLEGLIGCDLKEKFLNGRKSFAYECDPSSELLFSLPNASEASSESDDDILEKLNQNKNGCILEIDHIL